MSIFNFEEGWDDAPTKYLTQDEINAIMVLSIALGKAMARKVSNDFASIIQPEEKRSSKPYV